MDRDQSPGREGLRIDGSVAGPASTGILSKLNALRSHRLVWIAIAAMMIAFSAAPLVNVVRKQKYNKDYDLWQAIGRIVVQGGDVYPREAGLFPFMYPPACATMFAPIAMLPRGGFVASLLILNSAAWLACILCSVYLATGRLKGNPPELYFWPSMAIVPFIHDTYLLGQPAILLLALLLGSFVLLRKNKPIAAGALVAIAAGIKAYPILAIGYFLYRRQWRASASMIATLTALMFLLPLAYRTPGQVKEDFVLWTRGMLFKYDEKTIAQRPERAYSFKNQSIQATVHRLARPVLANGEDDKTWRVNLADLDFRSTTLLMLCATGSLGVFYLWSTLRLKGGPPGDAVEQSLIALMILMVAPLSFNYSYSWLLYPFTLLAHLWGVSRPGSTERKTAGLAIGVSVGLLLLTLPMPKTSQAYGNVFFSGVVLFVALGIVARKGWYRWAAQAPPATPHSIVVAPAATAAAPADWSI